jgi:hypothetical protein
VIVTSQTCGHCISFKEKHLNTLLKNLNNMSNLNIIQIDLPVMNGIGEYFKDIHNKKIFKSIKGSSLINLNIEKYIVWFPMFFLFPTSQWNNLSSVPLGISSNADISSIEKIGHLKTPTPSTASSLETWVKSGIENMNQTPIKETVGIPIVPLNVKQPGYLAPSKLKMKITSRPIE